MVSIFTPLEPNRPVASQLGAQNISKYINHTNLKPSHVRNAWARGHPNPAPTSSSRYLGPNLSSEARDQRWSGPLGSPDVGVGDFVGHLKHLKLSEGPCSNKTHGMVVLFLESPIWTCSTPCAENADSSATMDLENFQPSKFCESNGQSQHNVAIACHCHWGPLRPWLIWIAITVYWHSFTASVEKLLEHGGEAGWSFFQALHKEICAEAKGKPWKTHQKIPRGFGDFSYSPSICFILFVETPISPKLSQLDPPNIFSRHLFFQVPGRQQIKWCVLQLVAKEVTTAQENGNLSPHRNLKKHRSISPTCQHVATCRRGIPTSSWIQRFLLCQFQGSTPQFTKLGLTENRVPPKAESCCWFCWVILFQNWHSHKLGVYPTFSHTNILNFENAVAAAPSKLQRSRSFGHFSTAHFFRSRRKMILLETFHWRCYTCHTWTSETWQNTYQDSSSSTSGTHWNPKNDKQRQHPWFPRGLIAWTWPP